MKLSAVTKNLVLRINANFLFEAIEKSKTKIVKLDFKGIKSMSRSFAQQYLENKEHSSKIIKEINVPADVAKMFKLVKRKETNAGSLRPEDFEVVKVQPITV